MRRSVFRIRKGAERLQGARLSWSRLAQWVEQRSDKPSVAGSTPVSKETQRRPAATKERGLMPSHPEEGASEAAS